jgi:hypothetical protein
MSVDNLFKDLTAEILNSANNNFTDNYNFYRFGKLPKLKKAFSIKGLIVKSLNDKGFHNNINNLNLAQQVKASNFQISDFIYLNYYS